MPSRTARSHGKTQHDGLGRTFAFAARRGWGFRQFVALIAALMACNAVGDRLDAAGLAPDRPIARSARRQRAAMDHHQLPARIRRVADRLRAPGRPLRTQARAARRTFALCRVQHRGGGLDLHPDAARGARAAGCRLGRHARARRFGRARLLRRQPDGARHVARLHRVPGPYPSWRRRSARSSCWCCPGVASSGRSRFSARS